MPSNVKLSLEPSGDSLLLSWDNAIGNVDSFIIEMKGQGEPMFTPVATVDGKISQLLIEHLIKTKIYTFRIVARNSAGESDFAQVQLEEPLHKKVVTTEESIEDKSSKKKKDEKQEVPSEVKEVLSEVKPVEELKTEEEPKVKPAKTKKQKETAPQVVNEVKALDMKPVEQSTLPEDIKPSDVSKAEIAPLKEVKPEQVVLAEAAPTEQQKPAGKIRNCVPGNLLCIRLDGS